MFFRQECSLGIKTIISLKKKKKSRYAITNVSKKDISKIIKEFENLPYKGYVQKSSKHVPTDSYFYLAMHISKCMMRFNSHVGPVRTQMTSKQKMNNSEMSAKNILNDAISTQNIPNSHVFSMNVSKSKGINASESLSHVCSMGESNSKRVITNTCSSDKSESKIVNKSINTSEVKDAMNETKYEEPSVTDNSVINAPRYFKLFN